MMDRDEVSESTAYAQRRQEIAWLFDVAFRSARTARVYLGESGADDDRARSCLDQIRNCRSRIRVLRLEQRSEWARVTAGPGLHEADATAARNDGKEAPWARAHRRIGS
jgi:hypothetical protein